MSEPVWVPLGAVGTPKAVYPIDFRNPNVAFAPGGAYPLVKAAGAQWEEWAWGLSATGYGIVYGMFRLPENVPNPSTASMKFDLAAATAGDVRVQPQIAGIADGQTIDFANYDLAPAYQTVTLAARLRKVHVVSGVLIPTHIAPGELCVVQFTRDGAHASDTNASPLELLYGALVID